MSAYKVSLDVYNGPLDLLLFLIKREEVDIHDIPIARVTEQYLAHVGVIQQLNPEAAGDFLVLAATLMEIKSRTLLPRPPAESEEEEEFIDPRSELVRQLLEYKKFKDAARSLEHSALERAQKHGRRPAALDDGEDEVELENLEIWDLFEAFNRLLEQTGRRSAVHQVTIDDTPIALHAEDIVDSLQRSGGSQDFSGVFAGRSRAEMIGLFLALLELVRQRRVRATQERHGAPILLILLNAGPLDCPEETDEAEPAVGSISDEGAADHGRKLRDVVAPHEAAEDGSDDLSGSVQREASMPADEVLPPGNDDRELSTSVLWQEESADEAQ